MFYKYFNFRMCFTAPQLDCLFRDRSKIHLRSESRSITEFIKTAHEKSGFKKVNSVQFRL